MFKQTEKPDTGINPDITAHKLNMDKNYKKTQRELNSNILKITLKINEQYPELSKFMGEMPVTIPVHKKPEITFDVLSVYYRSLNVMLNTYIKEHPLTSTL